MKYRNGFVSNSSSSSFICDITGRDCSGWYMGIREAGMYECERGHTMDEDFVKPELEKAAEKGYEWFLAQLNEDDQTYCKETIDSELDGNVPTTPEEMMDLFDTLEYAMEFAYQLPSIFCPVCQLEHVVRTDAIKYFLKCNNMTLRELCDEIKGKFGENPNGFFEFISDVSLNKE